jgi:hypothetical protein
MNAEFLSKLSLVRSAYPSWDFDRSFQYLMAQEKHTGTFGRPTKSADSVLIAEAKDGDKPAEPKVKGSLVTCAFFTPLLPGEGEDEE